MDNSVRNNEKEKCLNQGELTVDIHTQLINALRNSERKKAIRNHPLNHETLIISLMNILARDQIHASDVYWRIILSQNCPKLDTLDKKAHWNTENTKTCLYRSTKIIKTFGKQYR